MREYEIRILRADKTTDLIMEVMHFSDKAAIRAAKKIAEARLFEVWRGLDCIFGRADGSGGAAGPRPAA
jgi:hypothetical protein